MSSNGPEARLVGRLRKLLENAGWKVVKNHGSRFSEVGIPDLFCFRGGSTVVIEVKASPDEIVTTAQLKQLDEFRRRAFDARVVWDVEQIEDLVAVRLLFNQNRAIGLKPTKAKDVSQAF